MSRSPFTSVQVQGGLLPPDLLGKLVEGTDVPGIQPTAYHLPPNETVRQAASRAWQYLRGVWESYGSELDKLGTGAATTGLTRERWLLLLFRELGFGRLLATPAGGITVEDQAEPVSFPVSHRWEHLPIHLLGWGTDLDRRTKGMAGAAGAAPQSMVQELLNRSDEHLWAVLSNGQQLRLLRDSTSLVGSAYVEFDLEAMFDGDLFADFVLLFLLAHQSRFEVSEDGGPASCWLETWRDVAAEQGTRALERLRDGVKEALTTLGTGFLQHPDNHELRQRLASGEVHRDAYHQALLRLAYRLLFWLVAEDRGVLLGPEADGKAAERYYRYFSAARLRDLARARRGDRHDDVWRSVRLVFDGLGAEDGLPELGLPGLGGLFDLGDADDPLEGAPPGAERQPSAREGRAALSNDALLAALRSLTIVRGRDGGPRRTVDFRNLGADELGSVYESLLELHPHHDRERAAFTLGAAAGNERKLTGSYYTPGSLIQCLLDSALDPLLDEACQAGDPVEALLNVTVCDPACGSGHFLVAAARRIAKRVAAIETDEAEPTQDAIQSALRRVVARCIHGVDVNPMAAELAKVALWLEAMEPGKPMSFLDANIRVGNSLLGATPALLADGIPNDAFKPIEGDEKKAAQALSQRNKKQSTGQRDLFAEGEIPTANTTLAGETAALVRDMPDSLAAVHGQEARFADVEQQRGEAKLPADAWCAAFVQPKTTNAERDAVTQATLRQAADDPERLPESVRDRIRDLTGEYGFFHWHLEFPHIFRVPDVGDVNPETGWSGGFSCVLGNPPWDRVKLQEQEFFATRDPEIADAPNASKRKKLIEALADSDEPSDRALHEEFLAARRRAEGASHFLRTSGRYPLTGRGDVNTYQVFAENDRTVIEPYGRTGMVLPTGIATDATTQHFFRDLVETSSIASLYDFENAKPLFPRVHRSYKFCLITMTGQAVREASAQFAFFAHDVDDLGKPDVVFSLKPDEITLLNPNTGTLPVFRSRRDAEITLGIYRRVPVLLREGDPDGNQWGVSFMRMFDMSNDSHLFHTREQLEADGWHLDGNIFLRRDDRMLPLYQGMMTDFYDHRAADVVRSATATKRQNQPRYLDMADHQDAQRLAIPAYWVDESEIPSDLPPWLLAIANVTSPTNERTLVAFPFPKVAVGHSTPLITCSYPTLLLSMLSSFTLDYLLRQKLGGVNLTYNYLKQLPALMPSTFLKIAAWEPDVEMRDWIADRVLELSYTSWDMAPFAEDLYDHGPPFRWDEERRELLRVELDAAYFHLYGVERDDVDYIMDTFPIVRRKDEQRHGEYRTKRLILDIYDAMTKAIDTGRPYQTLLDPPPGHGPRHPSRVARK